MRYIFGLLSLLFFTACTSGTAVHYDYASTTLNGADFSYKHFATSTPSNLDGSKKAVVASKASTQSVDPLKGFTFKTNPTKKMNDFALVIGISDYSHTPSVPYANNSALAFKALASKTFGLPKENIFTLLDGKATSGSIKSQLHLIKELADKDSTIYFYFAGHGLPSADGDTFILPTDMNADAIAYETNLKLKNIYKLLSSSAASKVIVVMDSCFSGKDDSGKLLYEGVAPVFKVKKALPSDKMTIFTAGGAKDFANAMESSQHRLFTYHFIKAVNEGLTNVNAIYDSTRTKVKRASLLKGIGYKQIPQIDGKVDQKLY